MAREIGTQVQSKPCRSCSALLPLDARACDSCGALTDAATFKERAEFEVAQWRAYKARATANAGN